VTGVDDNGVDGGEREQHLLEGVEKINDMVKMFLQRQHLMVDHDNLKKEIHLTPKL